MEFLFGEDFKWETQQLLPHRMDETPADVHEEIIIDSSASSKSTTAVWAPRLNEVLRKVVSNNIQIYL